LTAPGSYSIVVTATVEPTANTVTRPRSTSEAATTRATPSVRSTMCPLPGVSSRSIPPQTAIVLPEPSPAHLRDQSRHPLISGTRAAARSSQGPEPPPAHLGDE